MTRFVSPARSAIGRPGPEMNGETQPVAYTRTAGLWVVLAASAVMLLLLIFILQNGQPSEVHFLGARGRLPMGVALLLAAVFGVLLVIVPATVRRIQLRLLARRRGVPDTVTVTRPDSAGPASG